MHVHYTAKRGSKGGQRSKKWPRAWIDKMKRVLLNAHKTIDKFPLKDHWVANANPMVENGVG
jgi:hypothetical protein